jgi:SAM-dependent methyltransferase
VTGSVPFDRVATTYDATRGGMERGRRLAAVIAGLLPADGTVLEVGVGTGAVSAGLAELGRDMVGVDLSLPMLAIAHERLPGRVAAADALRLPVRTGSVSAACLIHVLHLVAEIPGTLAEAARVLRPGGTLVATGMSGEPGEADLAREVERLQARLGTVRRDDDPDLVGRLAADAGFELVDRRDEPARPVSPRDAADMIEAKALAWTWSIDADTWAALVEPAVARVRALPDQDRPRPGRGPTILTFHHT